MKIITYARKFVNTPKGKIFRLWTKKTVTPIISAVGLEIKKGCQEYNSKKATILIVSHEASSTGAPILALNICKELSNEYNIVVLILRGGELEQAFSKYCIKRLKANLGIITSGMINKSFKKIAKHPKPIYAIVNSIVSAQAIQPIRMNGIPVTTLIHEFSAYIRPKSVLDDVALWSNKLVFSSELTKKDILDVFPQIKDADIAILPQGKCKNIGQTEDKSQLYQDDEARKFLEGISEDTILVLGAGQIQPRKGIDIFVGVASRLNKLNPDRDIQFVWIGGGYDPENDFNVSIWINDQIKRSELSGKVKIFNSSPAYRDLLARSTIFLMTSRLDPLPNVSIDALCEGKPMLCFRKACGVATLLDGENTLKHNLVSSYLDISEMTKQANRLISSEEDYRETSNLCRIKAQEWFNMGSYIKRLDGYCKDTVEEDKEMSEEIEYLHKSEDASAWGANSNKKNTRKEVYLYILAWRNEVWAKKPKAGFHPGIYRDAVLQGDKKLDPFVHYLKAGKPEGPWQIKQLNSKTKVIEDITEMRVGVHIHAFYPEIAISIIERLAINSVKMDLFISYSNDQHIYGLASTAEKNGLNVVECSKVANRGRDIGPLISEFGERLDRDYEIYGHFHTKKSTHMSTHQSEKWSKFLLGNLIEHKNIAMSDRIISEFVRNKELGLVFADDPNCMGWGNNYEIASSLAKELSVESLPRSFNFPIGTMFWARQGSLRKLYEMNIKWNMYPPEPIDYDGTILHAIERLIPIVAIESGYTYNMVHNEGLGR